ncbi:DNA polymerase III subunit delta [Oceanobacillus profundus]|uniref:DNA polymerase III subunit delta n=1 Tax=Oceanobacillus profundus TaxID=372463 RepID=A0A417YJF2_9BACI|nr:DNA polymerase III subunit delta [Oceanobacillus profundus]PAE31081.1 DNA polymerase III subunit delta [Paenibacillus sp. 7884-2]RHW33131.1 DNA polymerase III subunit delta [Oceanobacillus profundus]
MSYIEVVKQLKKNQISSVYLAYGVESFFLQNLKQELIKRVLNGEEENLSLYDLEETPIQEVVADAETYPFFGEKKLVIATNPEFLKAKPGKLPFEHKLEPLERYLSEPASYSVLVLMAPYEKIDERKKISKQLKKHATIAVCNEVKEQELSQWINTLANQLQITIDRDAYEIFETELSTNLHLLENELSKLALYVGEGGVITKEVAENLVSHTSSSSSLRLVDAVMERNLHKAIAIFKDLEKMKEEPIALIGLLAFQFRTILRVKLLKQKGYGQSQIQKSIGAHPYVVKIALSRERQFSTQKLQDVIRKLADTDALMKQGKMEKDLAFELLLYDLIQTAS